MLTHYPIVVLNKHNYRIQSNTPFLLLLPLETNSFNKLFDLMAYRVRQPFNENMLRPCPVLDNPGRLTEIVEVSGARSTDLKNPENACDYCDKCIHEKYPERKITVIDSLCSSTGYGLLVDEAADMRDRGCSLEETEQWVLANRKKVHHQFFSVDLKYYRRSGRMSGAAATIGSVLNICPIMHLDDGGRIIAYDKVRGRNNAIQETIRTMETHVR